MNDSGLLAPEWTYGLKLRLLPTIKQRKPRLNDSHRLHWAQSAACQAAAEWHIYAIDIWPALVVGHCFDLKEGMNDSLKPGSRSKPVWVSPCSRVWSPRTKFSPARMPEARWGTSHRPYSVRGVGEVGGAGGACHTFLLLQGSRPPPPTCPAISSWSPSKASSYQIPEFK